VSEAPSITAEPAVPIEPAAVRRGRWVAYTVTWLSYGTYYFGRKGLSVAKVSIEGALGKSALYGVETAYLAAYALGQGLNGWAGDRIGARRLIGYGMLASAVACFLFGASTAGTFFIVAMIANGLAQSTGWPGNVKAMSEWTPPTQRGAVMGVWSTCYQVGGIAATSVAAMCVRRWGWSGGFFGPALLIAAVGVAVLLFLKPGPLALTHTSADDAPVHASPELAAARRRLLRSPLIWSYGVSYFCLKLIRYSLLLWLPYYLEKVLHYEKVLAANVSNAFEIGGIVGTILIGLLSDRLRHIPRAIIAAVALLGLAGSFYLYPIIGSTGVAANFLGLALIGFMLFGPDSLISGAAAQDAGGPGAAALAAGLINGIGSIGAIAQEAVTRGVSARWGWDGLFHVFLALSLISVGCLVPAFRKRQGEAA
jgi:sugar phosphate permease